MAAINLAKYRKAQSDVQEAEERAELAEQNVSRLRAKSKSIGNTVPTTPTIGHGGFGGITSSLSAYNFTRSTISPGRVLLFFSFSIFIADNIFIMHICTQRI